jgi:hypothetical protein
MVVRIQKFSIKWLDLVDFPPSRPPTATLTHHSSYFHNIMISVWCGRHALFSTAQRSIHFCRVATAGSVSRVQAGNMRVATSLQCGLRDALHSSMKVGNLWCRPEGRYSSGGCNMSFPLSSTHKRNERKFITANTRVAPWLQSDANSIQFGSTKFIMLELLVMSFYFRLKGFRLT